MSAEELGSPAQTDLLEERPVLLPEKNPYVSGEMSLFDTLVRTGEEKSSVMLPFPLHSFLVACLAEHLRDTEIVHGTLALGFLNATTKLGEQGNVVLKRTGDAALLLAGLFPERALRLHVSSVYFRLMGQAAYASLAVKLQTRGNSERGYFYDDVAEHFPVLEKVLGAVRARPQNEWGAYQRFRVALQ